MKQTEAVDVIYQLLPKMQAGDPVSVLRKYASDRKLAPAQLERLGHVFNTASTLATLEKDRNGIPDLMDVKGMVRGYVDHQGRAKRASWLAEQAEAPTKEASATVQDEELPDIWSGTERLSEKQAAAPIDLTIPRKRAFYAACTLAERCVEEEVEHVSDMCRELDKLAATIIRDDKPLLKYATLVADAEALGTPTLTGMVVDKLAAQLRSRGLNVENHTQEVPPFVLARDRTGLYSQLDSACNKLKVAIDTRSVLAESLSMVSEMAGHLSDDINIVRQAEKTANEIVRLGGAAGIYKAAGSAAEDRGKIVPFNEDAQRFLNNLHASAQPARENKETESEMEPWMNTLGFGVAGLGAASAGARRFVGQSVPAFLNEFGDEGTAAKTLKPLADKNQERVKGHALDRHQIVEDTRAVATLKDIMMRDEILSSKDPNQVFEAFQAIRHASPEVAGDKQMLTLLLRQALATHGLDIDTASAARKFEHGSYRNDLTAKA